MMVWDSFKFELKVNTAWQGGISVWISNVPSCHILAITETGLYREALLSVESGFVFDDNDSHRRVRFLRGNKFPVSPSVDVVSSLKFDFGNGTKMWSLKKSDGVDEVVVGYAGATQSFKRALLLTPAGIWRYVSCYSCGLPVDDVGRLKVLR